LFKQTSKIKKRNQIHPTEEHIRCAEK